MQFIVGKLRRTPFWDDLNATRVYKFLQRFNKIHQAISERELRALTVGANPIFLDVGVNAGGEVSLFLKLFPTARVFCFEPDERAVAAFKRKFGDEERVALERIVVSDIDGEVDFYPSRGKRPGYEAGGDWHESGSIKKPKEHLEEFPWCEFGAPIKVASQRLDTWIQKHDFDAIDLVWADVQGAEEDLIRGAQQTLAKTRYFYTEYSYAEMYAGQKGLDALMRLLPDFELLRLYRGNALLRNTRFARAAGA